MRTFALMIFAPLFILSVWIWSSIPEAPAKERKSESQRTTQLGRIRESKPALESELSVLLDDPGIGVSWGLSRTNAQGAWDIEKGRKDLIVAIIDTGVDVNHPDLRQNLWENPGEVGVVDSLFCKKQKNPLSLAECDKARNGIDDDGNGYVDDVHGWNFAEESNDLTDRHGHGTHIAGIIGAVGGNGIGISGVAPRVSLMILKYYDPKNNGALNPLDTTVRAIRYATKMGARIINYSAGGLERSDEEMNAIRAANDEGILFVAAAGNEGSNSDTYGFYPADYHLPNILSVTAIDPQNNVLASSNYGRRTVDLAAPGHEILSTLPNGQYGYLTGTSQATAFASGVAALLLSHREDLNEPWKMVEYLVKTGDTDAKLSGKTKYRSRLNAYRALIMQDAGVTANGAVAANVASGARIGSGPSFSADADFDQLTNEMHIPQRGPAHEPRP